jgi:hypothetical protein
MGEWISAVSVLFIMLLFSGRSRIFLSMILHSRSLENETIYLGTVKCKVIPVTGRGGPQSCETSRLPHFLENRLTDVGEIVSLTLRPPFTPRKISGTNFR